MPYEIMDLDYDSEVEIVVYTHGGSNLRETIEQTGGTGLDVN